MKQYRIKVLDAIAPEGLALFDDHFLVSREEASPEGILVRSSIVDTTAFPSLLAVARAGAGVNNITVEKATATGICVFNTPGANANAVAELVFTMLGIWARNIYQGIDFCRRQADKSDDEISRLVESHKKAFRGVELAGKTLGVIGLGKIGIRVANGGVQRQMRVLGFDPFPAMENIHALNPDVVLARSLPEVIRKTDILSLHMPLNQKTRHLVNRDFLSQVRPGAILVNYARGPIVDEEAVLAGLNNGSLQGYLTDFPSRLLLNHPRVLTSPHLGASTEESEESCACMAVNELKAYLEYGTISRSVNFPTAESIPADSCRTRLIMINRDIPGMIGFASQIIGAGNINIVSYLNESNGVVGYNIIDLQSQPPIEVIRQIQANPDVIRVRSIDCAAA